MTEISRRLLVASATAAAVVPVPVALQPVELTWRKALARLDRHGLAEPAGDLWPSGAIARTWNGGGVTMGHIHGVWPLPEQQVQALLSWGQDARGVTDGLSIRKGDVPTMIVYWRHGTDRLAVAHYQPGAWETVIGLQA